MCILVTWICSPGSLSDFTNECFNFESRFTLISLVWTLFKQRFRRLFPGEFTFGCTVWWCSSLVINSLTKFLPVEFIRFECKLHKICQVLMMEWKSCKDLTLNRSLLQLQRKQSCVNFVCSNKIFSWLNLFLVAPSGRFHYKCSLIFYRNRKQEAFF